MDQNTCTRSDAVYLIECKDIIELYDVKELLIRADSITIVANEQDPVDWNGSMIIGRHANDIGKLSSKKGHVITVTFNCDSKNYRGMVKITEGPVDMGKFYWVDFKGVDALHVK
jgi:hypothetical protein